MADEKKSKGAPAEDKPAAPADSPPASSATKPAHAKPAGFKVLHGSIQYAGGKLAHPGDVVQLGEADARVFLDAGVIAPA